MEERLNYVEAAPNGYRAMATLNRYVEDIDLEPLLLELVRMRASQINGCAYCLDMHSKDARALGESEQRLYALNAWRETPFYSERERAALLWTEEITLIHQGVSSKAQAFDQIIATAGLGADEVAYMGDDVVDLAVLGRSGLSAAPADAVQEVLERVDWVSAKPAGAGAVRELVEAILRAQDRWNAVVSGYLNEGAKP